MSIARVLHVARELDTRLEENASFQRFLSVLEQVKLVLSDVLRPQLVRWTMEKVGVVLHNSDVGFYGKLSIISTLEFLQHQSA